jgi:hypothetical protein
MAQVVNYLLVLHKTSSSYLLLPKKKEKIIKNIGINAQIGQYRVTYYS